MIRECECRFSVLKGTGSSLSSMPLHRAYFVRDIIGSWGLKSNSFLVMAAFRRVSSHHVPTWFCSVGWQIPRSEPLAHGNGAVPGVGQMRAIF